MGVRKGQNGVFEYAVEWSKSGEIPLVAALTTNEMRRIYANLLVDYLESHIILKATEVVPAFFPTQSKSGPIFATTPASILGLQPPSRASAPPKKAPFKVIKNSAAPQANADETHGAQTLISKYCTKVREGTPKVLTLGNGTYSLQHEDNPNSSALQPTIEPVVCKLENTDSDPEPSNPSSKTTESRADTSSIDQTETSVLNIPAPSCYLASPSANPYN